MIQMWDAEKGKLVHVEPRPFDGQLAEPTCVIGDLVKGSITFAPDPAKPCYCANCVKLEQDVERLRIGNAAVVRENHRLQRDFAGAMIRINELENRQFTERMK